MDTVDTSAPPLRGRVLVVSILLDSWLLFFSRALSRAGYDVAIVTTLERARLEDQDHQDILKYFLAHPFCHLADFEDVAPVSERRHEFAILGMRGSTTFAEKQKMLSFIGETPLRAIVLRRYHTEYMPMAKLVTKEWRQSFLRHSPRILVEDYSGASWMLQMVASTLQLGIVPHQRVVCQGMPEGLSDQTERPCLFNFLGSYDGPRVPIIDLLESRLQISGGGAQQIHLNGKTARIVWHADRPGSTRARPLNEYLDTLCGSYFTLCLPGHTILTHRVLEAIHCGSIPVLAKEAMPQYLLPLEHGRNCWLVTHDDWEGALADLIALDPKQILEIQGAVKKLAQNEASNPFLEKKSLRQLGLDIS